ncbi:MAG: alpha/beta hydrolase [Gammaproteobacteria bacterium]|nr:alpha/beta hydrolase [Gammaproteobacteria bacterium]
MVAPFDPATLRASLNVLVPGAPTLLTPLEDAYLRHYGIHFSDQIEGLSHQLGRLSTSTHDIAAHLWRPAAAKGSAVVIHGYYEHVGLYRHLIRFLLDRHLAVLSFDLPGHGLSTGEPATIETFDHYVDAFDAAFNAFDAHLPGPRHLFGQSTGGAVAMEWLLRNGIRRASSTFDKVVLLAPLVRPYLWPVNRVVYEVARRVITERPRTFDTQGAERELNLFLRDHDPLQAKTLPIQWITAMQAWRKRFENYPRSDVAPLVVQGHADRTVDRKYNVRVIQRLFEPRVFYIPEARHRLVTETPAVRAKMFEEIGRELDRA